MVFIFVRFEQHTSGCWSRILDTWRISDPVMVSHVTWRKQHFVRHVTVTKGCRFDRNPTVFDLEVFQVICVIYEKWVTIVNNGVKNGNEDWTIYNIPTREHRQSHFLNQEFGEQTEHMCQNYLTHSWCGPFYLSEEPTQNKKQRSTNASDDATDQSTGIRWGRRGARWWLCGAWCGCCSWREGWWGNCASRTTGRSNCGILGCENAWLGQIQVAGDLHALHAFCNTLCGPVRSWPAQRNEMHWLTAATLDVELQRHAASGILSNTSWDVHLREK